YEGLITLSMSAEPNLCIVCACIPTIKLSFRRSAPDNNSSEEETSINQPYFQQKAELGSEDRAVEMPPEERAHGAYELSADQEIRGTDPQVSMPVNVLGSFAKKDLQRLLLAFDDDVTFHNIPNVHTSYQALLDDPTIDAIYNPLPNGLHYEWTVKALQAGKQVLLEKPSVSNTSEACSLFHNSHLLDKGGSLVLLDAVHIRFHPAWQKFLTLIDPTNIAEATSSIWMPPIFAQDDIRFQYDLASGCLMDLGFYTIQTLRQVFACEPTESFYEGRYFPWLTRYIPPVRSPKVEVKHREVVVVLNPDMPGMETATTKTVILWDVLAPSLWHRIDVVEDRELRSSATGEVNKRWTATRYVKQYAEDKFGADDSWTTYRYMLEQFVNKVRGRKIAVWVDGEDSIRQMEMMDGAYTKAAMKVKPSIVPEEMY
ncbi:MAG: hypothetical protein Q9180_006740, partial [Flavoplaca navasiana]